MKRILVSLLLAACASGAQAWTLDRVVDGDTVSLVDGSRTVRIRLACIDAPEQRQGQGRRSTQALLADLQGKDIGIEVESRDRYGRTVAYLIVDGQNVNLRQVLDGWAWVYPKYCKRPEFYTAENAARAARAGLWSDDAPQAPWEYRRTERSHG